MSSLYKRAERTALKKKFKELKKEDKELKNMNFSEFKTYYYYVVKAQRKETEAQENKEADVELGDMFLEDIEEGNE